jgi:hypothetical protein
MSGARYATARRMTSASCSRSRIRFLASRSSADSLSVTPGFTPSSTSAFFSLFARHDLRDTEIFCDLFQWGFVLASNSDNIAAKLGWGGPRHGEPDRAVAERRGLLPYTRQKRRIQTDTKHDDRSDAASASVAPPPYAAFLLQETRVSPRFTRDRLSGSAFRHRLFSRRKQAAP